MTGHDALVERLAAAVHDAYVAAKHASGCRSVMSRHGTGELLRPYEQLADVDREDDRRTVRAVLDGLRQVPVADVLDLLVGLRDDGLLAEVRVAHELCDPPPADLADRSVDLEAREDGRR